jgi:hypothetical protein
MKLDQLVIFVEKFILDVIGVVLPGVILLLGLAMTVNLSSLDHQWLWMQLSTIGKWSVFVSISYVSGHVLHVFGEKVLLPTLGSLSGSRVRTPKRSAEEAEKSAAFSSFNEIFGATYHMTLPTKEGKIDFHTARSLAMTIATEVDPLTYKFMFISLMSLGVASAIFITGIVFAAAHHTMASTSRCGALTYVGILFLMLLGVPYLFLLKYTEFFTRALTLPFPAATVRLLSSTTNKT